MNKNICILFFGDFNYDARVVNMAESLISKKHSVTVLHASSETQTNIESSLINVINVPLKTTRKLKYFTEIISVFKYPPSKIVSYSFCLIYSNALADY